MKWVSLLILALLINIFTIQDIAQISFFTAEASPSLVEVIENKKTKAIIFSTPYGDIEEGESMAAVMGIFGNPQYISAQHNAEVWYYDFGKGKRLVIYFMNDKVTEVKDKSDFGS